MAGGDEVALVIVGGLFAAMIISFIMLIITIYVIVKLIKNEQVPTIAAVIFWFFVIINILTSIGSINSLSWEEKTSTNAGIASSAKNAKNRNIIWLGLLVFIAGAYIYRSYSRPSAKVAPAPSMNRNSNNNSTKAQAGGRRR